MIPVLVVREILVRVIIPKLKPKLVVNAQLTRLVGVVLAPALNIAPMGC
jgi:hypothetical protein